MAGDTRGFGEGFVQGFGLIDDYYRKNKEEKRQAGRDKAADEAAAAARAQDEARTGLLQKELTIKEGQAKAEAELNAARLKEAQEAGRAHRENQAFLREQRALANRKAADEAKAEKALQVMYRIHNGETPSDAELAELGEYNPLRFVRPEFTNAVAALTQRVTKALGVGGATTGANWDQLLDESIPDIQRVYGPRLASVLGDTVNGKKVKGFVIDDIKPGKVAGTVTLELGYETKDGRRGTIERPMVLNDMMDYLQGNNMVVEGVRRDPRFSAQLASLARSFDKRPESFALLGDSIAAYNDYKRGMYEEADSEWKAAVDEAAKSGSPPPDRKAFIDSFIRSNTMDEASYAQAFTMRARGQDMMTAKDARTLKAEYAKKGIALTSGADIAAMRDIELDNDPKEVDAIAAAFQAAKLSATPEWVSRVLAEVDAQAKTPAQEQIAQMAAQGLQPPEKLLRQAAAEGMQREDVLKRVLRKHIPQKQQPQSGGVGTPLPPAPAKNNSFSALLGS